MSLKSKKAVAFRVRAFAPNTPTAVDLEQFATGFAAIRVWRGFTKASLLVGAAAGYEVQRWSLRLR